MISIERIRLFRLKRSGGISRSDTRRLDGQVAIVTGGAQGLGRRIALVLAEAGAKIVIGDIPDASDTVQDIRSGDGQALSLIEDTGKPEDDDKLVN